MSGSDRTSPVPQGRAGRRENALETHRRGYRRAVRAGMLVSLVLHAVVILFVVGQLRIATRQFAPLAAIARPLEGLQVVNLRQEETEPQVTFIEFPSPEEERLVVERVEDPVKPVPVRGDTEVRGFTNPERLKPREGDRSIWKVSSIQPLPDYLGDPFALTEGVVRAGLARMLDSLEFTEKQRRRAVGWFSAEGDDGVGSALEKMASGEQLITLNLGSVIGNEGPLGREVREAARALAEIQRSDIVMDTEAVQRERVDGMRRRTKEKISRRSSSMEVGP